MLQRRAIVLPCFVLLYKKEEINTHFLLHALGSIPPPVHPAILQGRHSHVAKQTHQLSGTEMQTTHFVLSSRAFKSHHITGGGHQVADFSDWLVTGVGGQGPVADLQELSPAQSSPGRFTQRGSGTNLPCSVSSLVCREEEVL